MDVAQYFIKNKTSSWLLTLILLLGGVFSFLNIGKLEDPEYTIKQAIISTSYPGASPEQVEEEVSLAIEEAVQRLPYIDHVKSISSVGHSLVEVNVKSIYRSEQIPQIWDELRRRVKDAQLSFPPGVYEPIVSDDFGDVFGVLMAVTGDDFSHKELKDFTKYLKRELTVIPGVGKVSIQGEQSEAVILEISQSKLATLGIPPNIVANTLNAQNFVSSAGTVPIGRDRVRFSPSGEFQTIEDLKALVISNPSTSEIMRLGDIADIYKDYEEVPTNLIRYNGQEGILMGISFSSGVNVVEVGELITQKISELASSVPAGINIDYIYDQPTEVTNSVNDFLFNLLSAVAIVIVVLLFSMGWRSGTIIGVVLVVTVMGTLIFMLQMDIPLHRISLGALVIALGMLVDNAIVVTDGIIAGKNKKMSLVDAASKIVAQTRLPLLGATVIAITAFAPIGLSPDDTGEFAGSLFWVLLVSLLLSWVTAITLTPFFASLLLQSNPTTSETGQVNKLSWFKGVLEFVLKRRFFSYSLIISLFVFASYGFGFVKQVFFPPATTPIYLIDMWGEKGNDIEATEDVITSIESKLTSFDSIMQVTSSIGQGALRFMLTYGPEYYNPEYAQFLIRTESLDKLVASLPQVKQMLANDYPDLFFKIRRLEVGPSPRAKIEARFSGPDIDKLKELSEQAQYVLNNHQYAANVRDDLGAKTKVIKPIVNEATARLAGVTKKDIDALLNRNFDGEQIGVYRSGTDILPIKIRTPVNERSSVSSLSNLFIYSPIHDKYEPLEQFVQSYFVDWEYSTIYRRDRKRTVTVMADNNMLSDVTAQHVFADVRTEIEDIKLPNGYSLVWGGDYEASADAQEALFKSLPLGLLIMIIITILLFGSVKAALAVWLSVPLAIIGVASGMLIGGFSFGFMALLGLLSLSGMMIKNGIVLVDQINVEVDSGKSLYESVVDASVSRALPVSMAALTTMLGLIPLLTDPFFSSMAIVIIAGLGVATILTLLFVPLFYCSIFNVKNQ